MIEADRPFWEGFWRLHNYGYANEKLLSYIGEHLSSREGGRVLDLAAGNGRYGVEIAARYPVTVDAVEFAGSAAELMRENATKAGVLERVRIHQMDVWDFEPEHDYDVVVAGGIIEIIQPERRGVFIDMVKELTCPDGMNVWSYVLSRYHADGSLFEVSVEPGLIPPFYQPPWEIIFSDDSGSQMKKARIRDGFYTSGHAVAKRSI